MTTLKTDIEAFLKLAGAKSKHTRRTYQVAAGHLLTYLETEHRLPLDAPAVQITPEMLHAYPAWLMEQTYRPSRHADPRPLSENTCALYLVAAGNLLGYLVKLKRLPHFDAADIEAIRDTFRRATAAQQTPIHQKVPPDDIVAALIAAARAEPDWDSLTESQRHRLKLIRRRNIALLVTLHRTGLRVGEVVALRRKDLDLSRKGTWVTGKGRKTRFVPFHDEALSELQAYLELRQDGSLMTPLGDHPLFCRHDKGAPANKRLPITTRTVRNVVEGLLKQAGLSEKFHCTPHSLRHLFATKLLDKTGDLALVQDALGHANPQTTRIYAQTSPEKLARAVRGMD